VAEHSAGKNDACMRDCFSPTCMREYVGNSIHEDKCTYT